MGALYSLCSYCCNSPIITDLFNCTVTADMTSVHPCACLYWLPMSTHFDLTFDGHNILLSFGEWFVSCQGPKKKMEKRKWSVTGWVFYNSNRSKRAVRPASLGLLNSCFIHLQENGMPPVQRALFWGAARESLLFHETVFFFFLLIGGKYFERLAGRKYHAAASAHPAPCC